MKSVDDDDNLLFIQNIDERISGKEHTYNASAKQTMTDRNL